MVWEFLKSKPVARNDKPVGSAPNPSHLHSLPDPGEDIQSADGRPLKPLNTDHMDIHPVENIDKIDATLDEDISISERAYLNEWPTEPEKDKNVEMWDEDEDLNYQKAEKEYDRFIKALEINKTTESPPSADDVEKLCKENETKAFNSACKLLSSKSSSTRTVDKYWKLSEEGELTHCVNGKIDVSKLIRFGSYMLQWIIPLNRSYCFLLFVTYNPEVEVSPKTLHMADVHIDNSGKITTSVDFKFIMSGKLYQKMKREFNTCCREDKSIGIGFFMRRIYSMGISNFVSSGSFRYFQNAVRKNKENYNK